MAVFLQCPRCHQRQLVEVNIPCPTLLNNGSLCGYILPTPYQSGGLKYQGKCQKHSDSSASGSFTEATSYVNSLTEYMHNQASVLNSGGLYFDPVKKHPSLVTPIGSGDPHAVFHLPVSGFLASGTILPATHMEMPLSRNVADQHHRYRFGLSGLIPVADAAGLIVEYPEKKGGPYRVYSGASPTRTWRAPST